jgi:hypothetical protein
MNSEILQLLSKCRGVVKQKSLDTWPDGIECCTFGQIEYFSISIKVNRCTISFRTSDKKIISTIRVGPQHLECEFPIRGILRRQFCPVWQQWRALFRDVNKKHKDYIERSLQQKMITQRELFNAMFYSEFPEDIEDILLEGESDD